MKFDQNKYLKMDFIKELEENKNSCVVEIGSYNIRCNISGKSTPFILESPVFL